MLVVLFFVSVYGVKEGFKSNKCVAGQNYSLPTITTTRTPSDTLSGCAFPDCKIANIISSSKVGTSFNPAITENCYYGSPDTTTGKLTEKNMYSTYLDTSVTPNIYKWQA